jgi:hypothetical protein
MPLRKELLDLCQNIQNEHDITKLNHLLDELDRLLDDQKQAVLQSSQNPPPRRVLGPG